MSEDKEIKELKERLNEEIDYKLSYYHDLQEAQKKIQELKQQLAEKDKKITEYEQQSNYAYNIGRLQKLLKNKDERIAELRQENEQLKKQLAEKDKIVQEYESGKLIPKKVAEKTFEMRDKLLVEKDKEIAELITELKDRLEYVTRNRVFDITDHDKELRHQICEEIRNFMTQDDCITKEELIECLESFTAKSIFQLLDQIEQGE